MGPIGGCPEAPRPGGGRLRSPALPSGILRELQRTELGEVSRFVFQTNLDSDIRSRTASSEIEPVAWYKSRRILADAAVFMWIVEAARYVDPYATILMNDAPYELGQSLSYMPGQAGNLDPLDMKQYRIARVDRYLDRLGGVRHSPKAQTTIVRLGWEGIAGFLEGRLGPSPM